MGFLNSDIGYQIGLLAGGLWAERYREKGEAKKQAEDQHLNPDIFYQSFSLNNQAPYPYNAPYQNTAPYNPIRPYTFHAPYNQNR